MHSGGVGKSALTIRYTLGNYVDDYDPTVEDTYRKAASVDGTSAMLIILDTAGQEQYSMMRDSWMRAGDAFLLIFDVTSRNSFEQLDEFIQGLLRVKDVDSCARVPVVLVGNKCDLPEEERQVSTAEAQEKAKSLGCAYCEASAKMAIGIDEAFETAVRQHRQHLAESEGKETTPRRRKLALTKQCVLL